MTDRNRADVAANNNIDPNHDTMISDVDATVPGPLAVPGSVAWVEACWRDMETRGKAGEEVSADQYLTLVDQPNEQTAVDLVYGEYLTRKRHGKCVDADSFVARYPDIAEALKRQLELDDAMALLEDELTAKQLDVEGDESSQDEPRQDEPRQIGRYRVISRLGSGAQATVYRAFDPNLSRDVAIKVENSSDNGPSIFSHAEAIIAANLDLPGLAPVMDVGTMDQRRYIVSRYIDGLTLGQWVRTHRPTEQQVAAVVAEAASALASMHRSGILHLDLKPANIIIDSKDQPHVVDFGLACMNRAAHQQGNVRGVVRGTVAYMSPEQASADVQQFGAATDIFGLGATLMHAVCGSPPYSAVRRVDLNVVRAGKWDRRPLVDSSVSEPMKSLIQKAMATNPDDRIRSMDDLASQLRMIAKPVGRRTFALALGIGMVAVAAVLMIGWIWLSNRPSASPPPMVDRLSVLIESGAGRFVPLEDPSAAPRTGDRIRIAARVDPSIGVVLFNVSPVGQYQILAEYGGNRDHDIIAYPVNANESVPLLGEPGTELVGMAIGDDCDDISDALGNFFAQDQPQPLDLISMTRHHSYDSTGRLLTERTGIPQPSSPDLSQLAGNSRALGKPEVTDKNAGAVQTAMNRLAAALGERGYAVEIVAFSHQTDILKSSTH